MKKFVILFLNFVMLFTIASCGKSTTKKYNTSTQQSEDDETVNKTLSLKIENTEVDVSWLDNASVAELKKLAKDGLTIEMHKYSTFEQVGSIGSSITSSDTKITTTPGDICLYSSNKIVLFYGANTWEYTKLGHINLTKTELTDLLGNEDVVITFTLK